MVGAQQKFREAAEIVLQFLLIKRNTCQPQEVVLEVIQVPGDRLPVEAAAWIADLVVQIASSLYLKARQHGHDLAIGLHHRGSDLALRTVLGQELEERQVAQVFFQVSAVVQVFAINLGHRQAMLAEVAAEFHEGGVLFAHSVEDADRGVALIRQSDNTATGAAKLPLQGLHPRCWRAEAPLKELFEDIHVADSVRTVQRYHCWQRASAPVPEVHHAQLV